MRPVQETPDDGGPNHSHRRDRPEARYARALVVAKNEHARRWAVGRLRDAGFDVFATGDAFSASMAVRSDPPHLIVVHHAGGRFGVRCVPARLKRDTRTAGIPILLLSPNETGDLANDCQTLGVTLLVRPDERPGGLSRARRAASANSDRRVRRSCPER